MPPTNVTVPDSIARVETLISVNSPGYRPVISFGFWIAAVSGLSLETIATNMETALTTFYGAVSGAGIRQFMGDEAVITSTKYSKPLMDPQPVPWEVTRSLAGDGTSLTPPEVSMVASLRSDTAGPAFRGRFYLGGLAVNTFAATGQIAGAEATAFQGVVEALRDTLEGPTVEYPMVVLSRFHVVADETVERAVPIMAPVIQTIVDVHSDSQRRRGAR